MYFDSLQALWLMDGHGAYVWSTVLVAAIVILALLLVPVMRSRQFFKQQALRLQREATLAASAAASPRKD